MDSECDIYDTQWLTVAENYLHIISSQVYHHVKKKPCLLSAQTTHCLRSVNECSSSITRGQQWQRRSDTIQLCTGLYLGILQCIYIPCSLSHPIIHTQPPCPLPSATLCYVPISYLTPSSVFCNFCLSPFQSNVVFQQQVYSVTLPSLKLSIPLILSMVIPFLSLSYLLL